MKLTHTTTGSDAVLQIQGGLVIDEMAAAKSQLAEALKGAQTASFDLSGITECDAAGLQLLLMAFASLKARKASFTASSPSPAVKQAIERAGLSHRIMGIEERRA